jgi:hypothetical protein
VNVEFQLQRRRLARRVQKMSECDPDTTESLAGAVDDR